MEASLEQGRFLFIAYVIYVHVPSQGILVLYGNAHFEILLISRMHYFLAFPISETECFI